MITATKTSAVAVGRGCKRILKTYLGAKLTELALEYELDLPTPAQIYIGTIEDCGGVTPSIGIYVESVDYEPFVASCYTAQVVVSVTVHMFEEDAPEPTTMHETMVAYIEAVTRTLAERATNDLRGIGVSRAVLLETVAADSPYASDTASGGWTVRWAGGRVQFTQTIKKEEA